MSFARPCPSLNQTLKCKSEFYSLFGVKKKSACQRKAVTSTMRLFTHTLIKCCFKRIIIYVLENYCSPYKCSTLVFIPYIKYNALINAMLLSGFQMSFVKPKPKLLLWHIKKDGDNPVIQSKLEVITRSRHKARENVHARTTISFGFTCDWLKKWSENFEPITE